MKDFIEEDDPVLRQPANPVVFPLDEEERNLIKEMRQFLINSQDDELAEKYDLRSGVGVAAPQLGVSKQIFVAYLPEYDEAGNIVGTQLDNVFINPKIIRESIKKVALPEGEGCLSVRRSVPGYVPRSKRITLQYQDIDGETHQVRLQNMPAIVTQHEFDHLKGILFYDRIDKENPFNDEKLTLLDTE